MVSAQGTSQCMSLEISETDNQSALQEALREAEDMINAARKPVIIAGVELHRFGLRDSLLQLIEKTNIAVTSTLLGKAVMAEQHPRYLGVYEGALGHEDVRTYVESSDCLVLLGTFMTDVNLGLFSAHLDQGCSIYSTSEKTSIRYHSYEGVGLGDFIAGLLKTNLRHRESDDTPHPAIPSTFKAVPGRGITVKRLFQRLNSFLEENTIVIADTGDVMFAAADITMHDTTEFLSPAYYASLGYAVPASVGAQLANPELRPLVLVGDGAFQMTGMELSTVARYHLNPIVVVLNNGGYGMERPMLDGSFNDLLTWKYSRIPEVLGVGKGFEVETEDQLDEALEASRQYTESFSILEIHLDPHDISPALKRLTGMLTKRVKS